MNIFVAKLSLDTTEKELKDLFSQYGDVSSANIIMDKDTGRSKGFGFVEMDNDNEAQAAIEELNYLEFGGKTIVVKENGPGNGSHHDYRGGGGGYRGGDYGGYRGH